MIELFVCGSYYFFFVVLLLMIPDTFASGVAATGTGIWKKVFLSIIFEDVLLFQPQQLAAPVSTAKRNRRSMNSVFNELRDYYTMRACIWIKKRFGNYIQVFTNKYDITSNFHQHQKRSIKMVQRID